MRVYDHAGAKNIAKILLMPWQFSMYFIKHKCATM